MKKRIFIALLLVVFSLFTLSLTTVKAEEGTVYNFKADYNATGSNNVFTLSSDKGYVKTEVSNVDLSSVYISIKYTSKDVKNFDVFAYGTDENGQAIKDALIVYKIDSAWNKVEHTSYENQFMISTFNATGYFTPGTADYNGITTLTHLNFMFRGAKGSVVEILDFAITTDGKHGFSTELEVVEEEVLPMNKTLIVGDMTTAADVSFSRNELGEQVVSYSTSPKYNTFDVSISNYHSGLTTYEVEFYCEQDVTILFQVNGVADWATNHKKFDGGTTHKYTLDVSAANLPSSFTVQFYLDAAVTVETEKVVTFKSIKFVSPSLSVGEIEVIGGANSSFNEKGEQVISYSSSPSAGWKYFSIPVEGYSAVYNKLVISFTPENDTEVFFCIGGNDDWDMGYKVFEGGQTYTLTYDLSQYVLNSIFEITFLLDCNVSVETPNSVTFNKVELVSGLDTLLEKYYNDGVYTRHTNIFLTDAAKEDLVRYFHAQSNMLERTTYFKDDALWMTNEAGSYSYYGTLGNDMTGGRVVNVGDTTNSIALAGKTMEEHYTTMFDIKDLDVVWTVEKGVYTSRDEKAVKAFLDFTAPCFLNSEDQSSSNYFSFCKVTVEETEDGLVLKLWVDSSNYGAISNGVEGKYNLLSQAVISYSN